MPALLLVFAVKFIPLIVGRYYWRSLSLPYKLMYFQVVLAVIAEFSGWIIAHFFHRHNLWLFNCFHLVELWLLGAAAYYLVAGKNIRRNMLLLVVLGTLAWGAGAYVTGIYEFNTLSLVTTWLTTVIMYMAVLFRKFLGANNRIAGNSVVWLCLSVIIYFCCNIPYYGMFNYLYKNHPELHKSLFDLIVFNLNYIRYPLLGWSFYLLAREKVGAYSSVKA